MDDTDTAQKLRQALYLARRGWHVFPAEAKDKPHVKGWQKLATTDETQIREWWSQWPDALVCVVPGLSGKTAIDIDIHPARPSGFDSAVMAGAPVKAEVQGTSLSGGGHHLWYDGLNKTTQNVNGLASIDSRSIGGYIAMSRYALPHVDAVTEPIPEAYQVSPGASRRKPGDARVKAWLGAHDGEPSEHLAEYVAETPQPFRGRADMHSRVLHVVRCGVEGESGATQALVELRRLWLESPHNEADPEAEFDNSVRSNIRDYGHEKPVELTKLMQRTGLGRKTAVKDKKVSEKAKGRQLVLVDLNDVEEEPIYWAIQDVIPLGTFTILSGLGGVGKSTLLAAWLTQLINGTAEGDLDGPVTVLTAMGEDDLSRVLKPRMRAAGTDLRSGRFKVITIKQDGREAALQLEADLDAIRDAVQQTRARVVVLDPIISYVSGDPNSLKDVRAALDPIRDLATELNVAIIAVHHHKKGTSSGAEKLSGSHAWRDAARSHILVVRDEESGTSIATVEKGSYTGELLSFAFELESATYPNPRGKGKEIVTSRAVNLRPSEITAHDVLAKTADTATRSDVMQEIVSYIETSGPARPSEVAKALDMAPGKVREYVRRAERAGLIVRDGYGTYRGLLSASTGEVSELLKQTLHDPSGRSER